MVLTQSLLTGMLKGMFKCTTHTFVSNGNYPQRLKFMHNNKYFVRKIINK